MKKAKLILAAVAVLAIAGGSLAFKAAKRGTLTYFYTYSYGATATRALPNAIITDSGNRYYWTLTTTAPATTYSPLLGGL